MQNTASEIEQIDISIEHAKALVEKKNKVERLLNNPDFKEVITEGYCKDEAVRLASLSAEPHVKEQWEEIQASIQAISRFQQFIRTQIQIGTSMESELADLHETRDEVLVEGALAQ